MRNPLLQIYQVGIIVCGDLPQSELVRPAYLSPLQLNGRYSV